MAPLTSNPALVGLKEVIAEASAASHLVRVILPDSKPNSELMCKFVILVYTRDPQCCERVSGLRSYQSDDSKYYHLLEYLGAR